MGNLVIASNSLDEKALVLSGSHGVKQTQKVRSGNESNCKTKTGSFAQPLVGPARRLEEPFLKGASRAPDPVPEQVAGRGFPVLC